MDINTISEKDEMLLKQVTNYLKQLLETVNDNEFITYAEKMIMDGNITRAHEYEDYTTLRINNNKGKVIIQFDNYYNYIIKIKDIKGNTIKYELFSFNKEELDCSSNEKVLKLKPVIIKLDSYLKAIDITYTELRDIKSIDKLVEDILTR